MPTAPPSRSDLDRARIDWRQLDATTDAEIAQQAASDAASYVGRQAGNLGSSVGGAVSDAADAVRDRVEGGYNYVRDQGVSGIADDMAGMIRRNPVPSILIALGLGFLMARAIRG